MVLVALALLGSEAAAVAATEPATERPTISLGLTPRAAYAYRHEYMVVVRVRGTASSGPLLSLRVVVSGSMDEPGHAMKAGPARLRATGKGVYRAAVAFYMPGEWRLGIAASGRNVLPTSRPSTSF